MTLRIEIEPASDVRGLVKRALEHVPPTFRKVRVRTDNPVAAAFYEAEGFTPCADDTATHEIAVPSAGDGSS